MSRSRLVLFMLAAASLVCLREMRGDDLPKTTKSGASQVPSPKAISGKETKGSATGTKLAADKPGVKGAAEKEPAAKEKPEPQAPEIRPAKPTLKQVAFVKSELIPVYQRGEPLALLKLLSGQLPRWTDPQIAGLNQLLAELKAPTLDKMITDARMNLVRAGMADKGPEASSREAAVVLREIKRQIEEILLKVQGIELMQDPLPKPQTMLEFRDLLWIAHVQNNELINADGLAFQGNLISQSKVVSKAKNATPADKAIFATQFPNITAKIRLLHQELNERAIELRVERIQFAVKVLQESKDIKERFFAAYAVGVDGELLVNGFKEAPGPFGRESLNAPGYAQALSSNVDQGKQLAGDLVNKSRLLFAGLHWWRRGRYGRGPELNGLLKNIAAQTDLAAQIPLFMPRVSPVPVDPAKNPLHQIPDYDRRHHYTWAWQTRQFQSFDHQEKVNTSLSTQEMRTFDGTVEGTFL